jgi:DNA-directed RNA polymerase specialized sigma24 family protein
MNADEKELLDRVFKGDARAFQELLDRYQSLFYSVFSAPGFNFPRDYLDDLFQGFVVKISARDFLKLRQFEGRNSCSLATFLQVVATRFALDERRKFRRQPRAYGQGGRDDDDPTWEHEDPRDGNPDIASLERETLDTFHHLLFSLDWKRISAILWVFKDVTRERIAEVMSTSRANIDALYKRGKDQMTRLHGEGKYARGIRQPDHQVLTAPVREALRRLLPVPMDQLHEALLQPGAKRRAVLGLVLLSYPRFLCTRGELSKLLKVREHAVEAACLSVLQEVAERVGVAAAGAAPSSGASTGATTGATGAEVPR